MIGITIEWFCEDCEQHTPAAEDAEANKPVSCPGCKNDMALTIRGTGTDLVAVVSDGCPVAVAFTVESGE